eukprot:TRINITY_DN16442_c0_g2_i1.p1 TRINITY_DN16442_c0_g2~~TRINITY_DN16442_c0_g2_i1.p1  ORF type:complete len:509 (+),score=74.86 TRINITY_DN16442_c0_g2_i1:70-1527(+)
MTWNNTDLQNCLCWDTSDNDWCSDTQCESYFKHAYQGYVAGAVALVLLVVALLIWVTASIVRLCCCRKSCTGVPQRGVVTSYKVSATMLCVAFIIAAFVATSQAQDDGYDGVKGVLNVVSSKVNSDDASAVLALDSIHQIQELPGDYVSSKVSDKLGDIVSTVNDYSSKITSANSGILDNYSWIAVLSIWNPVLFILMGLIFIIASLRYCIIHINTWILVICAFVVATIQLVVGFFAFTSRDVCGDYDGVSKQVIVIWKSAFGSNYGNEQEVIDLTNDITGSFTTHFCYLDVEGWEEYFSHTHSCSQFPDTTAIVNEFSSVKSQWKDDAADCPGECTIRDCAVSCTPNSKIQQKAKSLVNIHDTISTNTVIIRNSLIPIVTGQSFVDSLLQLRSPLCDSFNPAAKKVNGSLSAIVFIVTFFIVALFFVSIIYYKERRSSYEVIQVAVADTCNIQADYTEQPNEETAVIEYPTKPVAYGSDAPVLK